MVSHMIEIDGIYLNPKHIEFTQCFDQPELYLEIGMASGKVFYLRGDLVKIKDIINRIFSAMY
jgi:hypothetical protein